MARSQTLAPYYAADASVFSNTTWVATVVGTTDTPLISMMVWYTGDQPLEWGYTAGTGNTAAGYIPGFTCMFAIDFYDSPLAKTVYIRKKAGGTTPGSGILIVNGVGTG